MFHLIKFNCEYSWRHFLPIMAGAHGIGLIVGELLLEQGASGNAPITINFMEQPGR
jgi:hypothetical protein